MVNEFHFQETLSAWLKILNREFCYVIGPDYPISECISPKKVQNTVLKNVDTSVTSEDRLKEEQSTEYPAHLTDTMSTAADTETQIGLLSMEFFC